MEPLLRELASDVRRMALDRRPNTEVRVDPSASDARVPRFSSDSSDSSSSSSPDELNACWRSACKDRAVGVLTKAGWGGGVLAKLLERQVEMVACWRSAWTRQGWWWWWRAGEAHADKGGVDGLDEWNAKRMQHTSRQDGAFNSACLRCPTCIFSFN